MGGEVYRVKLMYLICRFRLLLLLRLVFLFPSCLPLSQPAVYLLRFRYSLPSDSQHLLPWESTRNTSHCQWQGVLCYPTGNFEVKSMNLSGYGLSGGLDSPISHICQHKQLLSLDLSRNSFTGGIPELLGRCGRLHTLILGDNRLEGAIPPKLFELQLLTKLDMVDNSLSGVLPKHVGLCKGLEYLALANNFLTGEIPKELFSLPLLNSLFINTNNFTGSLPDFPSYCRLTDLWVHENNFTGSLPATLSNCRNLTNFYAFSNRFHGEVSRKTFAGLVKLEILYVGQNRIIGWIPDTIWELVSLQLLVLSGNNFTGGIQEELGKCRKLSFIDLSKNSLVGPIPRSIGKLKFLDTLFLYDNKLHGPIPAEIGKCQSLTTLQLHRNLINGSIPTEISQLENLSVLYLFNNQLTGHIPREIGMLKNLVELALYNNTLDGYIPGELTQLRKLEFLSLAFNRLKGVVPPELGKNVSPGIVRLDLTGNLLHGAIPSYICTGDKLSVLALGYNQFNGSFPIELSNCSSLRRVILGNNRFEGNIPEDIGANSGVVYLDIGRNFLEGKIPAAFGSWKNLSMLDFSDNGFSGFIPPELRKLTNLQVLKMSSNQLSGSIPSELSLLPKLLELDISRNNLSGRIHMEVTSFKSLQSLRLHENRFEGIIPDTFSSLHSLIELQLGGNLLEGAIPCSLSKPPQFSSVLNLSRNRLSGTIPKCLGDLSMLQVLDLSSNNFSGEIPPELNNMISLSFLNISFNHFSGELPYFWRRLALRPESSSGNPGLCREEDCPVEGDEKFINSSTGKLIIILTGSVVFVCLFCSGIWVLAVIRLGKMSLDESLLSQPKTELPDDLKFEDMVKGTEEWSNKYVIGRGKHGTVYRMESLNTKKQWAVKRVSLLETPNFFSLEAKALSYVRHRNVVKMVGYCISDGFGFIVTEYIPAGSLFDVLHKPDAFPVLDWDCRFRIALGIAQGLEYLHHDCIPKIIHRDIKSDNIFLDPELEPKIGDFGAAKIVSDTPIDEAESVVVGTLGYIAPENGFSAQLTEKCGVYSYGVILLELLCRKLPVDPCFEDCMDIVLWARRNLAESTEYVMFLDVEISFWNAEHQKKALELLDLALACTEAMVHMRPSMRFIVATLVKLNKR